MSNASFQTYDVTLGAGGSTMLPVAGDNFLVFTATGKVNVRGAFGLLKNLGVGQGGRGLDFKNLIVEDASGASNSVTILVGSAEFVNQQVILASSSAIALDSPTLNTMRQPRAATASYKATGVLAAATAEQVFAPAANLNGAIVLSATVNDIGGGGSVPLSNQILGFVAKATAPATILDGEPIFMQGVMAANATYYYCTGQLAAPQFVPAGLGLYFIAANAAVSANGVRTCRYALL